MNAPYLLVRADAGRESGYGHLVRSFALAQAWQDLGGRATLLTTAATLPAGVRDGGVRTVSLPAAYPAADDLRAVSDLLAGCPGAWVACDGYHFDAAYTEALQERGARVLLVDDQAAAPTYEADVVLNQNLGAERLAYACTQETRLLLGPRYALLRRSFAPWRGWRRGIRERAGRLLVAAGGSDAGGRLVRWMRALATLRDPSLEVRVLAGTANQFADRLETEARASSDVRFRVTRDVADVPSLMAWADLAVSAAGTTCWELCFMGLPAILLTVAENQVMAASNLARAAAAIHLGAAGAVPDEALVVAVRGLLDDAGRRAQLAARARALVDGWGATRVANVLLGRTEEEGV